MGYFLLYGWWRVLCGVGIPLYWTVVVRKRPVSDLGITTRRLWLSLGLQLVFAVLQFLAISRQPDTAGVDELVPLVALALTVGFFEAVFWRGRVVQRLEDSFGLVPAVLLGSALYSLYHIGYGMPSSEMIFLFFVGLMFAAVFLITPQHLDPVAPLSTDGSVDHIGQRPTQPTVGGGAGFYRGAGSHAGPRVVGQVVLLRDISASHRENAPTQCK